MKHLSYFCHVSNKLHVSPGWMGSIFRSFFQLKDKAVIRKRFSMVQGRMAGRFLSKGFKHQKRFLLEGVWKPKWLTTMWKILESVFLDLFLGYFFALIFSQAHRVQRGGPPDATLRRELNIPETRRPPTGTRESRACRTHRNHSLTISVKAFSPSRDCVSSEPVLNTTGLSRSVKCVSVQDLRVIVGWPIKHTVRSNKIRPCPTGWSC